jgi:NADH:ubiquinone oxidoreductase subunit F (NADH-binding)/(2Fe-2S) ferredoxin
VTFDAIVEALGAKGLKDVQVRQSGCMGLCHSEPTVEVSVPGMPTVIYGNVDKAVAQKIVDSHIVNKSVLDAYVCDTPAVDIMTADTSDVDYEKQFRIVLRNCGVIDPDKIDEYIAREGYGALEKVLSAMKPQDVIDELLKSGLRGRGGAGFPTGKKWQFAASQPAGQKYMVCNADEGDPGAYMDRSTLEGDPHSVLEAMTIAGYAIGASKGFFYIRAEYPLAIQRLETAIAQATEYGLLGENILGSGFSFTIEIRLGAGAFVCGEETALLASIEGKRGMPTPRPPFPAVKGLWGRPTVINNVETLANIPVILLKGAEWFSKIGTATTKGTKVFALTGKVNKCGLIEVPMGTTLRNIIFNIGDGIRDNKQFKAAQTGGPSGGIIPPQFLDDPIDYESLAKIGSIMGSGGLIVMDEDDCIPDIAKFYLDFTVDESCGKCCPCRIGGRKLLNYLDKICKGEGTHEDIENMQTISEAMSRASLCGLGQTASNPVMSSLRYFMDEYKEHIEQKKCKAGKCKNLLSYSIIPNKCVGCTACAKVCPANAIKGDRKQPHVIDSEKCIKCGQCFDVCKFHAVIRG